MDGVIYLSTPLCTVGLVVHNGRTIDGPPYARKCGWINRDARQLWDAWKGRPGVILKWIPGKEG